MEKEPVFELDEGLRKRINAEKRIRSRKKLSEQLLDLQARVERIEAMNRRIRRQLRRFQPKSK